MSPMFALSLCVISTRIDLTKQIPHLNGLHNFITTRTLTLYQCNSAIFNLKNNAINERIIKIEPTNRHI